MDIVAEYSDWEDVNGLVHPVLHPERGATQNGIRWTSEAYIIFQKHGLITERLKLDFIQAIQSCEVPGHVGLYDRCDTRRGEQEGPDDYHALIGACGALGLATMAKQTLDYGRQQKFHLRDLDLSELDSGGMLFKVLSALRSVFGFVRLRYSYNNNDTAKITASSWMGRFPALIAGMKYASGEKPNWFEKFWLAGSIAFSCHQPKTNQDAWALTWLLIQGVQGKSWFVDLVITYWKKRLYAVAPGGMREILLSYFNLTNYPTVKYVD